MDRHGRTLAKRLNVRRRVRFSETWPLPTGVWTRLASDGVFEGCQTRRPTAKGPFKATKFFLTLSIALSGMTVFPSFNVGVTSTASHSIGA